MGNLAVFNQNTVFNH